MSITYQIDSKKSLLSNTVSMPLYTFVAFPSTLADWANKKTFEKKKDFPRM